MSVEPLCSFAPRWVVVKTDDGLNVTLMQDLVFTRPSGTRVTVPAGCTSDGASTPAFLWSKLPPFGTYWLAAVLHDAAYRRQTLPPIDDRATADLLLWEGCQALGVSDDVSRLLYEAVMTFGERAWNSHRRQ